MPANTRANTVKPPIIKKVHVIFLFPRSVWSAHQDAHQKRACPEGNELSGKCDMRGGREAMLSGRGRTGRD